MKETPTTKPLLLAASLLLPPPYSSLLLFSTVSFSPAYISWSRCIYLSTITQWQEVCSPLSTASVWISSRMYYQSVITVGSGNNIYSFQLPDSGMNGIQDPHSECKHRFCVWCGQKQQEADVRGMILAISCLRNLHLGCHSYFFT